MWSVWAQLTSVSCSQLSLFDHIWCDHLALVGPAKRSKEIDEQFGQVEVVAKLAGCVIPWEGVMVVMESLAESPEGDAAILRWINVLVVWPPAPHMSRRVNQPGSV